MIKISLTFFSNFLKIISFIFYFIFNCLASKGTGLCETGHLAPGLHDFLLDRLPEVHHRPEALVADANGVLDAREDLLRAVVPEQLDGPHGRAENRFFDVFVRKFCIYFFVDQKNRLAHNYAPLIRNRKKRNNIWGDINPLYIQTLIILS